MKLSVSLRGEDVEFLDAYAKIHGMPSRSAAVAQAVRALRDSELDDAYTQAFAEWDGSDEAPVWSRAAADGL